MSEGGGVCVVTFRSRFLPSELNSVQSFQTNGSGAFSKGFKTCGCSVSMWCCSSHHVTGAGEVVVEQTFQSHPADRPVLIVPQTVVIHGKQVPGQSVVCDLHLHVVVNAVGGHTSLFLSN